LPNLGRADEDEATEVPEAFAAAVARDCLILLSKPKYNAEPRPVRMVDGNVPRQSWRIGLGPSRIPLKACRREVDWFCCTRVLSRSAGCKRKALATPDPRPATKWKPCGESDQLVALSVLAIHGTKYTPEEVFFFWSTPSLDIAIMVMERPAC
jgi:hypothetical protein